MLTDETVKPRRTAGGWLNRLADNKEVAVELSGHRGPFLNGLAGGWGPPLTGGGLANY